MIKLYWKIFFIKKKMNFFRKNKIVSLLILVLFLAISYESYTFFMNKNSIDRNSYFEIIEWKWKIKRWEDNILLSKWDKQKIQALDTVSTLTPKSLWIITWWDWSLTRIWWRSQIIIDENVVSDDLSTINIKFNLLDWKSWSNVISLMWDNSYFKQEFKGYVAWVRWTVFEVNLDKNYVFAKDHSVEVVSQSDSKKYIVKQWEVFSISLLKLIWDKIREKAWETLNENLDIQYLKELYASLKESYKNRKESFIAKFDKTKDISSQILTWESSISDILASNSLTIEQEKEIYDKVFFEYQKVHFLKPWEEWFARKMFLKSILLSMWWEKNRDSLVSSTVYDLVDASKISLDSAKVITNFISENWISPNEVLSSFQSNIWVFWEDSSENMIKAFSSSFENFNKIFWDNIEILNNIFWNWTSFWEALDNLKNFNPNSIKSLPQKTQDITNSFLEKILNK